MSDGKKEGRSIWCHKTCMCKMTTTSQIIPHQVNAHPLVPKKVWEIITFNIIFTDKSLLHSVPYYYWAPLISNTMWR